jgi:hypothetical protein
MKCESVCRVAGRGLALGMGICLAALLLTGGQALAKTKSTTTLSPVPQTSLAIEPESGYANAVMQLALLTISNRAGDPYFAASDPATRAQLAVYLARALQLPAGQSLSFNDVSANDWAYSSIEKVVEAGLMRGTADSTFLPSLPVSRQDAAAAVVAALRYAAKQKGTESPAVLGSSDIDSWLAGFQDRNLVDPLCTEPVAVAFKLGLYDMPGESWLLPKLGLSHQELLILLDRAFAEPVQAPSISQASIATVTAVDAYPKLSRGSKGSLVLMLQQRLNAMTYYCGVPDGKYSAQTRDAVLAFEKYERLKRNGSVDKTVWDVLWTAGAPVPVYQGDYGRRVEADLTRQVLMLIEDNKVVMTVHVSSGKYGTPTGDWHIRTRSRTWRPTSLGPVFAPCYFMARNAIHGYPSVPTYPASHNCIRTPIWIQLKIVDQLEMGELVHVFYNKATTTSTKETSS